MSIELKHLYKRFGDKQLFKDFNYVIENERILGISGPSGVGKTTLMRMLAGQEQPDHGSITGLPTEGVSFVFQDNRLLPWMTVKENIRFILKTEGEYNQISSILKMVGLEDAADQLPATLSGGQQKRVALARAFCKNSSLLLMDEPLTGLDTVLKNRIMKDFMLLWESEKPKRTVVLVSHDEKILSDYCDRVLYL